MNGDKIIYSMGPKYISVPSWVVFWSESFRSGDDDDAVDDASRS